MLVIKYAVNLRDRSCKPGVIIKVSLQNEAVGCGAEIVGGTIRINHKFKYRSVDVHGTSVGRILRIFFFDLDNGESNAAVENEVVTGSNAPKAVAKRR